MRTATAIVLAVAVVYGGLAAEAATILVPGGQPTIQAAIDAAASGDTLVVAAGTYREHLVWDSKPLTIVGAGVGSTILSGDLDSDGTGDGRCLTVTNVPSGRLEGFTIRDGVAPALEDYGGGATLSNSPITIIANLFTENYASRGAGLDLIDSYATVTGNTFDTNLAVMWGGGIYAAGGAAMINGNTIIDNVADWGAGVRMFQSYAVFDRNTICDNDQGGIWDRSGNYAQVKNCILMNNWNVDLVGTTATYSCVGTGNPGGTGNINQDPLFADAANGDYHLKSVHGRWDGAAWVVDAVTSPCIDAGDPTWEFDLEPTPHGARVNMGAYGNTAEASKSASTPAGATTIITAPTEGATTSAATVAVTGTAVDSDGVAEVNVRANGGAWMIATGTGTWSCDLPVPIGAVLIEARAQDLAGLWGPIVAITVNGAADLKPVALFTAPAEGAKVDSVQVLVSGTATDDHAVSRVILRINGGAWFDATGTNSWSAVVPVIAGPMLIEVRARDNVGQWGPIVARTIAGASGDLKPLTQIAAPADGSVAVGALIAVSGTAVDDVALDRVIVRVNGGGWVTATGTATWDTTITLADGANLIEARARDNAGQWGPIVGVTVSYDAGAGPAQIAGLVAQPSAIGGQLSFTLSAGGAVTAEVLNIAGRPIRTIVEDRQMPAGLNTLLWDGRSNQGLSVPNGTYLIRLTTHTESGAQAQGLTTLQVTR